MTVRMGLLCKKASWSDDEFRSHWLDSHGPLVRGAPGLRGYWQNQVLDKLQRGIDFERGPWNFDGFSQLWFDDSAGRPAAFGQGELAAALVADEKHFLGDLHIVTAQQTEVVALPSHRRSLLKRISTLRRLPALSEQEFRREWTIHAGLVKTMPGVSGYRQNVVTARERVKGQPCAYDELPIDGIVELWFDSPQTLDAAFASPQGQRTMAHARSFLSEITAFVVREHRIV
jgi:uncharacterized protein (TIGR02118 family)